MSRPRSLCVYCGKPGVTKEHILGKWSIKEYRLRRDPKYRLIHELTRWQDPVARTGLMKLPGGLARPGSSRSVQLKIACQECNNGWMKTIVDKNIPLLKLLLAGNWPKMTEQQLLELSSWLVLHSMSAEFQDRQTVCVSQSERTAFKNFGVPSQYWNIAIGKFYGTLDRDYYFHRAMTHVNPVQCSLNSKFQITIMTFGHLLGLSIYSEIELPFSFENICVNLRLNEIFPTLATKNSPVFFYNDETFENIMPILMEHLGVKSPENTFPEKFKKR